MSRQQKPFSKTERENATKNVRANFSEDSIGAAAQVRVIGGTERDDEMTQDTNNFSIGDDQGLSEGSFDPSTNYVHDAQVGTVETQHDGNPNPIISWEWADVENESNQNINICDINDDQQRVILELFDIKTIYGPFDGITRLRRWQRARTWGLNPPILVRRILDGGDYNLQTRHHKYRY